MNEDIITCMAVDDEPPALLVIEKYITAVPVLKLVATCNNAVDALKTLQHRTIDLLFLDIEMPYIRGTDFMRTLVKPPKVIFTTAFRKYAVEGFDLDAVDYLLKPVSFERFLKAVNKVMLLNLSTGIPMSRNEASQLPVADTPFIYIRADRKNFKVMLDDILFIESLKDYIKIVTKEKTIVTKQPISSLEETLPARQFMRVHRSFVVPINKIESFTRDLIQVGKFEIPVSRTYRNEIEKMLTGRS